MKETRNVCLVIALILLSVFCMGCASLKYTNEGKDEPLYMVTRVKNTPDGWSDSEFQCYYYNNDTKIVYFGSNNLGTNGALLLELKSEEYRNYIYDEENNKFIGVK